MPGERAATVQLRRWGRTPFVMLLWLTWKVGQYLIGCVISLRFAEDFSHVFIIIVCIGIRSCAILIVVIIVLLIFCIVIYNPLVHINCCSCS